MHKNKVINLFKVSKSFLDNEKKIDILDEVDLEVYEGEKIAIVGPSGSGKSTILSLIAGLDTPDSGEIMVDGKIINKLKESEVAKYRNQEIGVIFQSFELILPFTVYENVSAPKR
jgi:predicted ABC-type transport system involved in lysophospholipase L1 biosynthesis ATPase subunit